MKNRRLFKSKISIFILTRILLISGVFTLIITAFQLYSDYQDEIEGLHNHLANIKLTQLNALATATWDFNEPLVKTITLGMTKHELVSHLIFTTSFGKTYRAGTKPSESKISIEAPVIYGDIEIGTIVIYADEIAAQNKIKDKFYIILLSQTLKTFLVSLFILILIYQAVVKHIETISTWLTAFNPKSKFNALSIQSNKQPNEIDFLKVSINQMGSAVHRHTKELEDMVDKRTHDLEQRTIELEAAKKELEKLAYTDSLTGVNNRFSFLEKTDKELSRSKRLGYSLGLMMLDLDHFKLINDNYGHDAGDQVLQRFASTVKACLRKEDTFGRLGGEEFAIVIPGGDKIGMHKLANRLREAVEAIEFSFFENGKNVTISIGYTQIRNNETIKTALKRADTHLYTAKDKGRNCIVTDKELILHIVN